MVTLHLKKQKASCVEREIITLVQLVLLDDNNNSFTHHFCRHFWWMTRDDHLRDGRTLRSGFALLLRLINQELGLVFTWMMLCLLLRAHINAHQRRVFLAHTRNYGRAGGQAHRAHESPVIAHCARASFSA